MPMPAAPVLLLVLPQLLQVPLLPVLPVLPQWQSNLRVLALTRSVVEMNDSRCRVGLEYLQMGQIDSLLACLRLIGFESWIA